MSSPISSPRAASNSIDDINDASPFRYEPVRFVKSYERLRNKLQTENEDSPLLDPRTTPTAAAPKTTRNGKLIVAAVQLETAGLSVENEDAAATFLAKATEAVKKAATELDADVVLLQELFLGPYFCQSQDSTFYRLAEDLDRSIFLEKMRELAKSFGVVLPVSLFERKNNAYFNTVVMIDSDGSDLGLYRKSHIPDGTGYQEKFYFSPGDTGFKVFQTKAGAIGVGICWDQWFPEAARSMALMGADLLLYPTAIGSEPQDPGLDSSRHWQRVMQGHAAANMVPVVAANRYGTEVLTDATTGEEKQRIHFFGKSFITDETGEIIAEAKDGSDIIVAEIYPQSNREKRAAWGLFRDRRPELYGVLLGKDGVNRSKIG